MEEILVSVIIPIYNGEKYIEKIYDNFQNISNFKVEILLIDDGSKDNSLSLCKKISRKDSKFKVYHKENSGIADTRNFGVKKSQGKYCFFFDQDDQVVNEGLELMVDLLNNSDSDFCIANSGVIVENHREQNLIIQKSEYFLKNQINQLVAWLIGNGTLSYGSVPKIKSTVWNCLFRREFLIKNKIAFERYIDFEDDWVFLIRCLLSAEKICMEKTCVYYWRINPVSESHSHKYVKDFYWNRKKLKEFINYSLDAINLDEEKRKDFEVMFQRRTFLWNLFNECYSGEGIKKQILIINEIHKYEFPEVHYDLIGKEYSKKENLLLRFLLSGHSILAYLTNKLIFKFHFH